MLFFFGGGDQTHITCVKERFDKILDEHKVFYIKHLEIRPFQKAKHIGQKSPPPLYLREGLHFFILYRKIKVRFNLKIA